MVQHPALDRVVERIQTDVIGGAADTAKEVVDALAQVARDSSAKDATELAQELEAGVDRILAVLPSLAPPVNALHMILGQVEELLKENVSVSDMAQGVVEEAQAFQARAEEALQRVAQFGAEKIKDGDTIFTYSMSSTVWRVLRVAKAQGKSIRVIVTESRPANEGLWTVEEMAKIGVPVAVSIDACIGLLVPGCTMVMVGADAVSSSGQVLCKVGTYPTALVARAHGVPFYVAADTLKFDTTTLLGLPFRIDPLHREQVLPEEPKYGQAEVVGLHFDITPPALVTAVITEIGLAHPTACFSVMRQMKLSERLAKKLPAWAKGEWAASGERAEA